MASPARTTASPIRALLCAVALALLAAAAALLPARAPASTSHARAMRAVDTQALYRSRLLWATIDVCNPPDQPSTIGIRGSMPGDAHAHDAMYMRFRLQYTSQTTKQWTDLTKGASARYMSVGSGASARQAGRSFRLSMVAGQPAFTLRGVVVFQWRQGTEVVAQVSRPTSAGRESLAGADPTGFSSATCVIG
jgi:hypothetical protein